jgi:hypothetical protein
MLKVTFFYLHAEYHYAECRNVDCRVCTKLEPCSFDTGLIGISPLTSK